MIVSWGACRSKIRSECARDSNADYFVIGFCSQYHVKDRFVSEPVRSNLEQSDRIAKLLGGFQFSAELLDDLWLLG